MTAEEAKRQVPEFEGLAPAEQQTILRLLNQAPQGATSAQFERPAPQPSSPLAQAGAMAGDMYKSQLATTPGAEVLRTVQALRGQHQGPDVLDTLTPARPTAQQLAPNAGEMAGQMAGLGLSAATRLPAGLTVPALGTAGAMAGTTLEAFLRTGKAPAWRDVATEGALTAAPHLAEGVLKGGKRLVQRAVLYGTTPGRVLRQSEQFARTAGAPQRVFTSPTDAAVDEAFDAVRASGFALDPQPVLENLRSATPAQRDTLTREVARANATVNARVRTPNDRTLIAKHEELMQAALPAAPQPEPTMPTRGERPPALPPGAPPTFEIGDVQNLRSALRERLQKTSDPALQNLLQDYKDDLDSMVINALTPGGHPKADTAELLLKAREGYARLMAANDLSDLFLQQSKLATPGTVKSEGKRVLNLVGVMDALDKNTSKLAGKVNSDLDRTPEARENLQFFLRSLTPLSKQLEVVGNMKNTIPLVGAMMDGVSQSLLSRPALEFLVHSALANNGQITPNILAYSVNLARRNPDIASQLPQQVQMAPEKLKALMGAMPAQGTP